MATFPRGPRRRRPTLASLVLEVPVIAPQRRLHAWRAFVKPHDWTREAVRHRLEADADGSAEQEWEPSFAGVALDVAGRAAERLGVKFGCLDASEEARLQFAFVDGTPPELARGVAVVCSRRLPKTWWTLHDLALLDGHFYRRGRGRAYHLSPATNVHLPLDVRATLRDLL